MLIFVPLIWLIPDTFKDYQNPNTQHRLNLTTHGKNIDAVVTFALVLIILIVEFMQLWFYMVSDWAKVWLICKYIENPSRQNTTPCMEKFVGFFCRQKSWFRPWQNKISQYSLDSFDHNPLNLQSLVTVGIVDKERQGQKQSPAISLPREVKKAIIRSLRINNGQLTNGVSSLLQNGVSEILSWACQQKTQTQTILVWHIATALCEIAPVSPVQQTMEDEPNRHCTVACSLSKYCAYLVAFAPELLPDHSYSTQKIFDMVVLQTRDILKGMKSVESRYERMMSAEFDTDTMTITEKGSKLGKQLMEEIEDGTVRWKVLADFWSEMMIVVAPSDNATAHLEHLAQGGEFVTHIWALLSHAGILARPEPTLEHV